MRRQGFVEHEHEGDCVSVREVRHEPKALNPKPRKPLNLKQVIVVPNPAWGEDKNMTFYMDKRDENRPDEEYVKKYPCVSQKVRKSG